jgi:hypothetical protein
MVNSHSMRKKNIDFNDSMYKKVPNKSVPALLLATDASTQMGREK